MLIQFAFFTVATSSSRCRPASWSTRSATREPWSLGLFTMGVGALLFIPAASVPRLPLFLTALIVARRRHDHSASLRQSLRRRTRQPEKTAASRLNLAQAFNSLGTTIGPKLGGFSFSAAAVAVRRSSRQIPPADLQAYRVARSLFRETAVSRLRTHAASLSALPSGLFKLPRSRPSKAARRRRSQDDAFGAARI